MTELPRSYSSVFYRNTHTEGNLLTKRLVEHTNQSGYHYISYASTIPSRDMSQVHTESYSSRTAGLVSAIHETRMGRMNELTWLMKIEACNLAQPV